MTGALPGWYFPQGATVPWWWDGSQWLWEARDVPIRLDEPTSSGLLVRWVGGPEYGAAADGGWYPSPDWVPSSASFVDDAPAPRWRFARADSEHVDPPDFSELTGDSIPFRGALDTTFTATAQAWTDERGDKELHRGIDQAQVPLSWVAPPQWPAPPVGWSPPSDWQVPRNWPLAPEGWEFWQPNHEIVAAREHALRVRHESRTADIIGSFSGVMAELNAAEETFFWVHRKRSRVLSPLPCMVALGADWPSDHPVLREYWSVSQECLFAAASLRTAMLGHLYQLFELPLMARVRFRLLRAVQRYNETLQRVAFAHITAARAADLRRSQPPSWPGPDGYEPVRESLIDALPEEGKRWITDVWSRRSNVGVAPTYAWFSDSDEGTDSGEEPSIAPWERAEELAASFLRQRGFSDATRVPDGADGGFDVTGRGVVAQVKYHANPVGRPDLQRLAGANQHGATAVFFSRAGYTQSAISFAEVCGMALFSLQVNPDVVEAENERARVLER